MKNSIKNSSNFTVDVIVPVFNPGKEFAELLRRLQKQTEKIRNIIIMHTLDGRGLEWAQEEYDNIIICDIIPEKFDHGGTRNEGIQLSDADIVVCMTQDAMPADTHLMENLLEPLSDESVAISYARQLPDKNCDIIERYTRRFNYPDESCIKSRADVEQLGIKTYFCSNVCAAYKRDVYLQLGGFTAKTIFNEDMIFASKAINACYKVAYSADAKVIHSHNYSCGQQFRRNFDMAVSQADHPDIFKGIKSETEGIRLVKQTARYLMKERHPFKIITLVFKSGAKFCGYKLGLNYRKLPGWIIKKCTMNPRYWGKK